LIWVNAGHGARWDAAASFGFQHETLEVAMSMPIWIVMPLVGTLVSLVVQAIFGTEVLGRRPPRTPDGRWVPPVDDLDPVCDRLVRTQAALASVHDGHVYYFCSPQCRQRFETEPARYVSGTRHADPAMMEQRHDIRHA
jgi:YHS domain-containing protein